MIHLWSLIVAFSGLAILLLLRKKPKGNSPPGPWSVPILGHLPLMGLNPPKKILQWSKIYGPIISVQFGSFPTVILNEAKLVREAFNLTSLTGRPKLRPLSAGCEGKGIAFTDGPAVAEQRQFVLRNLRDFGYGSKSMEEKMREEVADFVDSLKPKAGQLVTVNRLFSVYVVNCFWSIVMGEKFNAQDVNHLADLVTTKISRSDTLFSKLAMFLPFISTLMPNWSGYNDKVNAFQEVYNFVEGRIGHRKLTWVKDQPRDLTDTFFDKADETTDPTSSFHPSVRYQAKTNGDLFMGGVETTSSSLEWLINYLARDEKIQKKLQEEIDHVVGNSRLPSLSDRVNLPYCEATVLELLRTTPTLPFSLFHRALEDVEFHGFTIPKDTNVIANIYGVHNDPAVWSHPELFMPERFISNGELVRDDNLISFSSGKRACLGSTLAKDSLFLFMTCLFQSFNAKFPSNAPEVKGYFGLTWTPAKFQVVFTQRH